MVLPFFARRQAGLTRKRNPRKRRFALERLEERLPLATLPANFAESTIASGLTFPTAMELAPDGKLFITEEAGTMEVWQTGSRLQANFFQNTPLTPYSPSTDTGLVDSRGERGLLSVAFDPNYASNRYVYVYYTYAVNADGNLNTPTTFRNRVSRFTANVTGDLALAGSEQSIVELDNLSTATNHNGGAIHFGADGKLYIGVGDNANAPNAQTLGNRLGKVLRVNSDGTIPTDNPFYNTASGANRAIWALGLRNPFTFTVQPGTGRLFINDVGANTWEEINDGAAGANYGWPATEGDFNSATFPNFTRPFYAYSHGGGAFQGYAITGGAFYNPSDSTAGRFPVSYNGDYFFSDYVNGWINVIDVNTKTVAQFATDIAAPVDLRVAPDGSLYYLSRNGGFVGRIEYSLSVPTLDVTGTAGDDTLAVVFSSPTNFNVTINGSSTSYTTSQFPIIKVDGLGGNDKIVIGLPTGLDTVALSQGGGFVDGVNYHIDLSNIEVQSVYGDAADTATLNDSSGNDFVHQYTAYSVLYDSGRSFENKAVGFGRVIAVATSGADYAYQIGSGGNDTFVGGATNVGTMVAAGVASVARGWDRIYAYARGGTDVATLAGTGGNDKFYGLAGYSILIGPTLFHKAIGFDQVTANAGLGTDIALLYDSAGNDTMTGSPTTARLTGPGFNNIVNGFDRVYGIASAGGNDTATFDGSNLDDHFYARVDYSVLMRSGLFFLQSQGFEFTHANLTTGGNDIAVLIDSPGNDFLAASGNFTELVYAGGNRVRATAFDTVYARGINGGANTRQVINPLAFTLVFEGNWV